MNKKKKIMIFMGRYLPGYRDGGPVRTIINLVDTFSSEYEIMIVTSDRDHGDLKPYESVEVGKWNRIGAASVFYVSENKWSFKMLYNLCKEADLIYCCGPYNKYTRKLLLLNKLKLISSSFFVAPMGSFSEGAFKIKSFKKKMYIQLLSITGLFKNINWSVTSELEKKETKLIIKERNNFIIAEDLPRKPLDKIVNKNKNKDELDIIFLSRISRKKNLDNALNILKKLDNKVNFHIYGYIEDSNYWDECKKKIELLPSNVKCEFKGEASSEKILHIFSGYDVFLFPTKGENFGHVIYESLAAGCIPVISDTTPWIDFDERRCGSVIELTNENEFQNTIKKFSEMDKSNIDKYRINANLYAKEKYKNSREYSGYHKIFNS